MSENDSKPEGTALEEPTVSGPPQYNTETLERTLRGAISGASAGVAVGSTIAAPGALVGAVVGFVAGVFLAAASRKAEDTSAKRADQESKP